MFEDSLNKVKELIDTDDETNKELAYELLVHTLRWSKIDAQILVYKKVNFTLFDKLYLSGYEYATKAQMEQYGKPGWDGYFGEGSFIVVNDWTFLICEDPEDGYRSHLDDVIPVGKNLDIVKRTWKPIRVEYEHRKEDVCNDWGSEKADIHVFNVFNTLDFIVKYGTYNTDDWYPYYVCKFSVENLNKYIKWKIV